MKKLLILLLCLVTIFSVTGCSSQSEDTQTEEPVAETTKVIDLGGSLGTITLEGEAFGSYKVIETPEELIYENTTVTVYEDLNSNTPYIIVWRLSANGDKTLEEIAQEEADLYAHGYYQLFDSNDMVNFGGAYYCNQYEYNGNFYYNDTQIFEDGDDFVELSFLGKTEEIQIGDTNVYAYVPAGYTDLNDDDYKAHGTIFCGEYSEDYYFPSIWIGKFDTSYEFANWYWELEFPNGIPYTEEEYNELINNWENDDLFDYYEKLGFTIDFSSRKEDPYVYDYEGEFTVLGGLNDAVEIWFIIDGNWYSAWFESDLVPTPAYAETFLLSLHTK